MALTEDVVKVALGLAPDERARLARDLIESLGEHRDVDATEAWTKELRQRLDDVNSGAVETLSLEAVREMVAWLDGGAPLEYAPEEAVHVLEAIVAFHASHAKNSAWVELPLEGDDREIEVRSG